MVNKIITVNLSIIILSISSKISPAAENETELRFRIYKGFTCSTDNYPYMVLLAKKSTFGWTRTCGGTLLSAFWVLSAAHCMNKKIQKYAVMAALSNSAYTEVVPVRRYFIHPLYDADDYSHDVAVLKLEHALNENKYIGYVDLPEEANSRSFKFSSEYCKHPLIMGWGKVDSTSVPALKDLQCARVPILDMEECAEMFKSYHNILLTHEQMCTLSAKGIDACQGDSGGPLLCDDVQYGIISWGIDCGKATNPGVYTRVDIHVAYINDIIEDHQMDDRSYNSKVKIPNSTMISGFLFIIIIYHYLNFSIKLG